jgi:hypothetical protein
MAKHTFDQTAIAVEPRLDEVIAVDRALGRLEELDRDFRESSSAVSSPE